MDLANADASRDDEPTVVGSAWSSSLPEVVDEHQLVAAIRRELGSTREGKALSLVILAVGYDDVSRRPSTDRVLHQVTGLVQVLELEAKLVRTGVNEMAILLPGVDLQRAKTMAGAIRDLVEPRPFDYYDRPMTISLGVDTHKPHYTDDELIRTAKAQRVRAPQPQAREFITDERDYCIMVRREAPDFVDPKCWCFVVIYGADLGRRYDFNGHEMTIGRASSSDICISEHSVSRMHAIIMADHEGVKIRDNESKNGTHVNGTKIHEVHLLQHDDLIEIGRSMLRVLSSSDIRSAY